MIFSYAPGTLFRGGKILQAFTAIARVADDEAYPAEMVAGAPWRRRAVSIACDETPIAPLVPLLDFITQLQQEYPEYPDSAGTVSAGSSPRR